NKGEQDGMEVGHVLAVYRAGETIRDPVTEDPKDTVTLPDEHAGVVLVFRTFDRLSYALVMEASRPMHLYDKVRRPER
nr:peptidoglycan-binding protein [Gammaproteobacteria bacterium]